MNKIVVFSLALLVGMPVFAINHATLISCPSQNFKVFLEQFTESSKVQKAFTHLQNINNDEINFPLIPNEKARKNDELNLKIDQLKKDTATVVLDKDETDYRVKFFFKKQKCWILVRVDDLSG